MAKGPSGFMRVRFCQDWEALVNTGGPPWPDPWSAKQRVLRMQAKLHLWATKDPGRRFDDLFNLVYHPDFLTVAWERVRGNKGACTAGVDRVIPAFISDDADVVAFLGGAREQLKSRTFTPLPVRERMIPKSGQRACTPRCSSPASTTDSCAPGLAPSPSPAMPAPLRAAAHTYQKAMDTLTRDLGLVA
jgi:RNA-directed DNA polymerase